MTEELHSRQLREEDADADPLRQLERWYAEAAASGLRTPEAVALATASAEGAPSLRMVLLKGLAADGLRFYTGHGSRKARELAENPRAALLFHWSALGRQVRVEGPVERLPEAEADAYFASRPRGSRLAAWASRQSEPLGGRDELETAVRAAAERFADYEVPRPPHWGGYRLLPARYEFWQHREDRLHDRLLYLPSPSGWTRTRLAP